MAFKFEKIFDGNNGGTGGGLSGDITLDLRDDGRLYLVIDGKDVGNSVPLPSGGASGDVVGNISADNTIILSGNISDGTYTIKYEMEDGSIVDIGPLEKYTNVYYSVSFIPTNCTINNSATQVVKGQSYSATITANSGYELKSVTVTMGGANVSVTNGVINIANVTGDIVITAVADVVSVEPTNLLPSATFTADELASFTPEQKQESANGYVSGWRVSLSSGTLKTAETRYMTGFIPCKYEQIVEIQNIDTTSSDTISITPYNSSKQAIKGSSDSYGTTLYKAFVEKGEQSNGGYKSTMISSTFGCFTSDMEYIRICSSSITSESVITVTNG